MRPCRTRTRRRAGRPPRPRRVRLAGRIEVRGARCERGGRFPTVARHCLEPPTTHSEGTLGYVDCDWPIDITPASSTTRACRQERRISLSLHMAGPCLSWQAEYEADKPLLHASTSSSSSSSNSNIKTGREAGGAVLLVCWCGSGGAVALVQVVPAGPAGGPRPARLGLACRGRRRRRRRHLHCPVRPDPARPAHSPFTPPAFSGHFYFPSSRLDARPRPGRRPGPGVSCPPPARGASEQPSPTSSRTHVTRGDHPAELPEPPREIGLCCAGALRAAALPARPVRRAALMPATVSTTRRRDARAPPRCPPLSPRRRCRNITIFT